MQQQQLQQQQHGSTGLDQLAAPATPARALTAGKIFCGVAMATCTAAGAVLSRRAFGSIPGSIQVHPGAHQTQACGSPTAAVVPGTEEVMAQDTSTLQAQMRDKSGKGPARRLRAKGLVPAVCYGPFDKKPLMVAVDPEALTEAIATPHNVNTGIKLEVASN